VLQGWDNPPSLLANTEFLEIGRRLTKAMSLIFAQTFKDFDGMSVFVSLALTRAFQGSEQSRLEANTPTPGSHKISEPGPLNLN
jgi:hypothetical protein